jgi:hypothetical protein
MAGSANIVEMFLTHGVKACGTGFHFAGDLYGALDANMDSKATASILSLLNELGMRLDFDRDGSSLPALDEAVRYGNCLLLKELLKLGADMTTRAGEHGNLLHAAVSGVKAPRKIKRSRRRVARRVCLCVARLWFGINSPSNNVTSPFSAAMIIRHTRIPPFP